MKKPELLAVHRAKLEEFIKSLGLWESLSNGELKCVNCGALLSLDNIGLIIPLENIQFCCNNSDCILKLKSIHSGEYKYESS